MFRKVCRVIVMMVLVSSVAVALSLLQTPPEKSQGVVVFSNMTGNDVFGNSSAITALSFDVPVGQDYQINSVQLRLGYSGTVNLGIYTDNAGSLGTQIIDLGTQSVSRVFSTITFIPSGSAVLPSGNRYWLAMTQPGQDVFWWSSDPPILPTGLFTFVNNGFFVGGTFFPRVDRFKLSIDADPYFPPPPSTGANVVPACTNSDGRLNSICEEPWQTAAIYCRADGTIDVYGITDGAGWLAFRTTQSEIDAVGVPTQNSLIERSSDGKIRLYRLATGEFQVNAPMWDEVRGNLPDGYVFRWASC